MRISVINPNTTSSMTKRIGAAARAAASSGTQILERQSTHGPDAIEGPFDGALAVPGLLDALRIAEAEGVDAHVIACFDDTGLDAARALSSKPVVGIGEAAFHLASLVAHSFCVVTTLTRSAPVIEDNIRRYGFGHRCRRVFASDIPVLELENPQSNAVEQISLFVEQSRTLGAEAVVLGCAGMAEFAATLSRRHGLPIIEGVSAAVGLAETLSRCALTPSKTGIWAEPTRQYLLEAI
jgi:allantoin racemase